MDSYRSILDKISVLQRKASSLRENEKKRAVAEIRKLIDLYDIQPADLFHGGKSSTATGKRPLPPKYRDPATGKTWNGHGKSPFWLKGDRDKYLIAGQINAAEKIKKAPRPKGWESVKRLRKRILPGRMFPAFPKRPLHRRTEFFFLFVDRRPTVHVRGALPSPTAG